MIYSLVAEICVIFSLLFLEAYTTPGTQQTVHLHRGDKYSLTSLRFYVRLDYIFTLSAALSIF